MTFLNSQDDFDSEYIGFDGSPDVEHGIYAFIYVNQVQQKEMFDLLLEYQESPLAGLYGERLDNLSPCWT